MYQSYNYNIPINSRNMYRNGDRIFGGGFAVPFILGGIAGSVWNNRPNNFYPVPYPIFFNSNPWNNTWNNTFYY